MCSALKVFASKKFPSEPKKTLIARSSHASKISVKPIMQVAHSLKENETSFSGKGFSNNLSTGAEVQRAHGDLMLTFLE